MFRDIRLMRIPGKSIEVVSARTHLRTVDLSLRSDLRNLMRLCDKFTWLVITVLSLRITWFPATISLYDKNRSNTDCFYLSFLTKFHLISYEFSNRFLFNFLCLLFFSFNSVHFMSYHSWECENKMEKWNENRLKVILCEKSPDFPLFLNEMSACDNHIKQHDKFTE